MDPSIHAWVQISPQRPTGRGALSEIPFGVKDVIETRGLATEYDSPIYKGRIGKADAAIVRDLRKRGAILLGKTHTAAFAYLAPPPTRNPRDLEHTPATHSFRESSAQPDEHHLVARSKSAFASSAIPNTAQSSPKVGPLG
jgi:hypothetical protein